jgi:glutamate dehydrogenase/leucine dehydrogenase
MGVAMISAKENLLTLPLTEFISWLRAEKIHRFFFITDLDTDEIIVSHPQLQPIAVALKADKRDYDRHEGLFFGLDKETDTLFHAAIHKTCRGQAAGGMRFWQYPNLQAVLGDGLRLARGMTLKNALAGLWWGGGKGVMAQDPKVAIDDKYHRPRLYRAYGEFISSLQGCYVTAEDVGTGPDDMREIFSQTRFVTCIPPAQGGSGNPSAPTAAGIISGMEAALEFLGMGDLRGRKIAIQGVGHVGQPLIGKLLSRGVAVIIGHDINAAHLAEAKQAFPDPRLRLAQVDSCDESILQAEVDIFAPCATGAILNERTIPRLRCRIICGAANNQLEDTHRDGFALAQRNILYVPDFLTNRMGIVTCANEQYGYIDEDPALSRHLERHWEHSIFQAAQRVFAEAAKSQLATASIAQSHADRLSEEMHPLFGHRGYQIIRSLQQRGWANA